MPVNRGRRPPRRIPTAGASGKQYGGAFQAGWDLAAKLEAIAEARRRQSGAPPISQPRPSPAQQRARRMPSAEDLLGSTSPSPGRMPTAEELLNHEWDDVGVRPLPSWADQVQRMPTAEELLNGDWDGPGPPGSDDGGGYDEPSSTEWYSPTRSICPPRPRTLEMSYDRTTRLLRITYRDGGTYDYFDVPGPIWYRIRQVKSPGRFIDRNIKGRFAYEKVAM